jgi:hypothetical protein
VGAGRPRAFALALAFAIGAALRLLPGLPLAAPGLTLLRRAGLAAELFLQLPEGVVAQVLLIAQRVLKTLHRLLTRRLRAVAAFALGDFHVLQHLLQRVQHLLRFGHAAFLHQLLDPAQHLLEVGHRHLGALALVGLVGVVARLRVLGKLAHVIVHRLAQLLHELCDFLVAGALPHGLAQAFLRLAEPFQRVVEIAFFQEQRGVPEDFGHLVARVLGNAVDARFQPPDRGAQLQIHPSSSPASGRTVSARRRSADRSAFARLHRISRRSSITALASGSKKRRPGRRGMS